MWINQNTRFICSPGAAAESLRTSSTESNQSAPSKSCRTNKRCLRHGCPACRYGKTFAPSEATTKSAPESSTTCGESPMTLLLPEASLAKTSHAREKAREYAAKEADCGRSMRVSFAKFDPVSCLWRIPHFLFQEDWATFSQTWPRWGMMVHGECYQLPPWVQDTGVTVFGEPSGDGIEDGRRFYCTPTTVEAKPSAKSWHKNPTVGDVVAEEREKIRAQSAWPTVTVPGTANMSD